MKIPKTFELAGRKWKVKLDSRIKEFGLNGRCYRDTATILLDPKLDEDAMNLTFCHELIHAIMYTRGLMDYNEQDVDGTGRLLHQFMKTAK